MVSIYIVPSTVTIEGAEYPSNTGGQSTFPQRERQCPGEITCQKDVKRQPGYDFFSYANDTKVPLPEILKSSKSASNPREIALLPQERASLLLTTLQVLDVSEAKQLAIIVL